MDQLDLLGRRQAGVRDSKSIADSQILKLDELIRGTEGAVVETCQCGMAKYNELMLKPRATWPEDVSRDALVEKMSQVLTDAIPGANFGFSQPIEMRVDELVAGVKADVEIGRAHV